MAPYSKDLRTRVLGDSDAGMPSKEVAAKYSVSRAGRPAETAAARNGGDHPASANEVSSSRARRPGRSLGGADHRAAGCDLGGVA